MALDLYLLRHAQSVEKQVGQTDKGRTLNPQGIKNSLLMGAYLKRQNLPLEIIFSSTAERAKTTAQLVVDAMKLDFEKVLLEEELYEASMRTFLEFITKLEDGLHHVMCVGHNPVISYLAEYLTKAEIGDMVPAGLVMIRFNLNSWKKVNHGTGELIQYIHPDLLSVD